MNVETIIERQRTFFSSNQTKDIGYRIEQLKKLKHLLKKNQAVLYNAIYRDFGKSKFDTYMTEFSLIFHEINDAIKNVRKWSKYRKVATPLVHFPAKSYIIPEPLGAVFIIGAWNYPYQISLIPALTALAAGNTVILKPSELPSETSKAMAQIINAHFADEYFYVVEGGVEDTTKLLKHRFDKIFFTGSTTVGKIIYEAAARHLTPVTLELGGKNPTFVFADTDMEVTARRIVWAKFLNAGQTCIAPDYVLVEKSVERKFLEAVKNEAEKQYSNHGLTENYTRIINTKNFDRLCSLLSSHKIYAGGYTSKEERFISPTILHEISFTDDIMQDEIFGPVLPVISFTSLDYIITEIKSRPKPLSCYIYSKNRRVVDKILKEISFGGGSVNDSVTYFSNCNLPFGGVGMSGIGSYHGKTGFDTFSHLKSIYDKPFWLEPNLKYAPYSKRKLNILKWLLE